MTTRKKAVYIRYIIVIMLVFLLILCLEIRKPYVCHSSVFTTAEQTEISLHVLTNALFPVNEEMFVKKIISEDQRINGVRENVKYYLILYRSRYHYRRNCEYKTIVCDKNGVMG